MNYETQLNHLVKLASVAGWKAYAWQRAKELDKEEMWSGIAADLQRRMSSTEPRRSGGYEQR